MIVLRIRSLTILCALCVAAIGYGQVDTATTAVSLNNLDAFNDPPKNWIVAANATADFLKPQDLKPVKGTGAVVNDMSRNNRMHLFTKAELGDVELELYFMMAKNSNSGVYLQGRYEIQLLDSWTRLHTGSSDVGGIYSRWDSGRGTFEGTAPLMNVARAPGLWQHLRLTFRAPRFDHTGAKIRNARFDEVYLNGVLVQQAADVTGPTASSMYTDEKPKGPLVLQGDHGPVAFKNIRYRQLPSPADSSVAPPGDRYWETRNPVLVQPQTRNYLLRSFVEYGSKVLTHVVSVGSPAGLNYSYDLSQGALVKIWRGQFLDVTRMWVGRGEPQLARPLGSVITLDNAPSAAVVPDENTAWPDSVAFDDLQQHGYLLSKERNPVFSYALRGVEIKDSIVCEPGGTGITRTVSAANPPANFFCRVASGKNIERLRDDLYAIDDRSFYIQLDSRYKPAIRTSSQGNELIVRYDANSPITYSIIW